MSMNEALTEKVMEHIGAFSRLAVMSVRYGAGWGYMATFAGSDGKVVAEAYGTTPIEAIECLTECAADMLGVTA